MQAQNTNSDYHIHFPGWSHCFGKSQASNYPDQVSEQRDNVGASLSLASFPLEPSVQGSEGKILIVCTRFSLKNGVRTEPCFFIAMLGKPQMSLHGKHNLEE